MSGHIDRSSEYRPHRPAETVLYQLVAQHLETFLAEAREQHERGLPAYVEKEFRAFLECGIHAFGFLRALCKLCGRELLVLPEVPVRQWVLSVPFELRLLLARNPRALSAVGRLLVERVLRW